MTIRTRIAGTSLDGVKGDQCMNEDGKAGSRIGDRSMIAHDPASGQGLSDHTQKRIGIHLRAMYDTVVQQPVPDRFRDLIAQLESSDPGPGSQP